MLHYTLVKRKDLQNSSKMTSKSLKEELQVKNGIFSANTAIPIWKQIHGYVITTHLHHL